MTPLTLVANVVITAAVVAAVCLRGRPSALKGLAWLVGALAAAYFAFAGVLEPIARHGADFNQYLVGAADLMAGRDPYADYATYVGTGAGPVREILGRYGLANTPPISYPPPFYVVVSPLLLLPSAGAFTAWTVANALAWLLTVALACRALGIRGPAAWVATLGFSLLSNPVVDNMYLGQANILLTLALTAALYALVRGKRRQGGLWAAAATTIKLYPAVTLVWFALRRRWRELAAALLFLLGVVAASAAIWGVGLWPHYVEYVVVPALTAPITMAVNTALATAPLRFAPPGSEAGPVLIWAGKITAVALLLGSLVYFRRLRLDAAGEFSFIVAVGLAANNWLPAPYLTATLLPFAYLASRIFKNGARTPVIALTVASFLVIAWRYDYRLLREWPTTPLLAVKPLALATLWAAFVLYARDNAGSAPREQGREP